MRQSLSKVQSMYSYLFSMLVSRYQVFLAGLTLFWDQIVSSVVPSDKIKILELKHTLFSGIEILKTQYFE